MVYRSRVPFPSPPDDLTIPQFMLDVHHFYRPQRPHQHPWLIDDKSGKAYGLELCRYRTSGLANALSSRFAFKEDNVAVIFSPNHLEYPIAIWACHRLGGIISGANPAYTPQELTYQLTTTSASLLFTHTSSLDIALKAATESNFPFSHIILFDYPTPYSSPVQGNKFLTVEELVQEGIKAPTTYVERKLKPGEGKTKLAFLSFSSGTTGKPKAVAIAHASLIANVLQMAMFNLVNEDYAPFEKRRYRAGDTVIGVLPFYHIYGLVVNLHWMIYTGLAIVVVQKFVFEEMLKSIENYKITHLFLVPPHIVLLCKHPATQKYNLSSLRYAMVGAAPLSVELTQQFLRLFPHVNMGQGYGMTETCTTVIMNPVHFANGIPGSAGQLMPGTVARIIKSDGTQANVGEPGELWVKGPQMALKYLGNEEATKETFVDGWVKTGDEVIIDKDGNFFVTDRIKEIFKVKGFQVAPAELEGHILEHPDVADCAVIPIPDDYSGEVPMAYVTLQSGTASKVEQDPSIGERVKESIKKHVSDAKVRYKWLDGGVEFVDVIPKNPSGKLLRRVLRERAKETLGQRGGGKFKAKL